MFVRMPEPRRHADERETELAVLPGTAEISTSSLPPSS